MNTEHVADLVRFIKKEYGRLDILTNNAGIRVEMPGYERGYYAILSK